MPIKLKAVPENIRVWDFLFFGCAVYIYSKHWEHTKQCKKYFFTYLFHRVTKTTFDPPLLSTNKSKQTIFNVGPNYTYLTELQDTLLKCHTKLSELVKIFPFKII